MLKTIRSPWFSLGAVVVVVGLAVFIDSERGSLIGLAAFIAFWGMVDWVSGTHKD